MTAVGVAPRASSSLHRDGSSSSQACFDAILHACVTRMLGGEADTRLIQHLVGHADWSTSANLRISHPR